MNNSSLVDLVAARVGYLDSTSRSQQVLDAMRKVDRRNFIPDTDDAIEIVSAGALRQLNQSLKVLSAPTEDGIKEIIISALGVSVSANNFKVSRKDLAYNDIPLEIGYDQTCSQPSMVAFMAEVLELKPGMKVLEIGTGCGYHAAVTAELLGRNGKVYSVERFAKLVSLAEGNLRTHFGSQYQERIQIIHADGSIGLPDQAPFDAIYFTAGVTLSAFEPGILAQQLKLPGGVLLYPEQNGLMVKEIYGRHGNIIDIQFYHGVRFVPLIGQNATREIKLPHSLAQ